MPETPITLEQVLTRLGAANVGQLKRKSYAVEFIEEVANGSWSISVQEPNYPWAVVIAVTNNRDLAKQAGWRDPKTLSGEIHPGE